MYSITTYLYQQIQTVLMIDTSGDYFDKRWRPVYAKNLKINLGVDNVLLFQFLNQDQKPVNITGSTFIFRLISNDGKELIYTRETETLNASTGRVKVTIPAVDTLQWDQQLASWSLEVRSGSLGQAVFVDDYAGARGTVDIVNSVFPAFVSSQLLTLPDQAAENNQYHSSVIDRDGQQLTTFQISLQNYTGNISVQGASDISTMETVEWYTVDFVDVTTGINQSSLELTATSQTQLINVEGYHHMLRLVFDTTEGNVSSILYR